MYNYNAVVAVMDKMVITSVKFSGNQIIGVNVTTSFISNRN